MVATHGLINSYVILRTKFLTPHLQDLVLGQVAVGSLSWREKICSKNIRKSQKCLQNFSLPATAVPRCDTSKFCYCDGILKSDLLVNLTSTFKKFCFITFKSYIPKQCFLLLYLFFLNQSMTSEGPPKIVQRLLGHPVVILQSTYK